MDPMGDSQANQVHATLSADDDAVQDLSQRFSESLNGGGSQHTDPMAHTRASTPDFPDPSLRLPSIPLSDPGALCGPDDDPAARSSQNSRSSDPRMNSQPSDRSDDLEEAPPAARTAPGAHFANRARANSVYDSVRYPFPMRRFWHDDGLLVCPDSHIEFLYSQAKCMGLAQNTEKSEAYGISWSFVFPFDGFGLPEQMIRAIHFFTIVEALSTHSKMNGHVVQTENLDRNLSPKFNDKEVVGVLESTRTDGLDRETNDVEPSSIDFNDLLTSSENSSAGVTLRAVPLLHMNIGITGALYSEGGKEKRKLFGILYVHWLLNVDFMTYLLVSATPRWHEPSKETDTGRGRGPFSRSPARRRPTSRRRTRRGTRSSTPSSPCWSTSRTGWRGAWGRRPPGISSRIPPASWGRTTCATRSGSPSR